MTRINKKINDEFDRLIQQGCEIKDPEVLKNNVRKLMGMTLNEALRWMTREISIPVGTFLNKKTLNGVDLVSGIHVSFFSRCANNVGSLRINVSGGYNGRDISLPPELLCKKYPSSNIIIEDGKATNIFGQLPIDNNTIFDVASITKLFTLLLTLKLCEEEKFSLESKIGELDASFSMLGDLRIIDLMRLCGGLKTVEKDMNGNPIINDVGKYVVKRIAGTLEEARSVLYNNLTFIESEKDNIEYNDLGAIILAEVITNVISKTEGFKSYDQIMEERILKPLGLEFTRFNPHTTNMSGNNGFEVQDEKARSLGGVSGHAGIYTNNSDLILVGNALSDCYKGKNHFLTAEHINMLTHRLSDVDPKFEKRGYFGEYKKDSRGFSETFVPNVLSDKSFAWQGWTGSAAIFDLENQFYKGIMVNMLDEDENGTHQIKGESSQTREATIVRNVDGFMPNFEELQAMLSPVTAMMLLYSRCKEIETDLSSSKLVYKRNDMI